MPTAIVSRACPTFFRAWCRDASGSGSEGFELVGRQLAGHLIGLTPNDHEDEAWHGEMARLQAIIDTEDREAVLRWFLAGSLNRVAPRSHPLNRLPSPPDLVATACPLPRAVQPGLHRSRPCSA